jgi:GMP synthase-like glutamine amidotransferase
MIRIAILDMNAGRPNQGLRCIQKICAEFVEEVKENASFDTFEVRIEHQIPKINEYDIFISSGGPGDPTESGEKWEDSYFKFINQIIAYNIQHSTKKYLFLICHSFQMVARHLEIGLITKRKSTAFGIFPVHKTKNGNEEAVFDLLPNPFHVVDSRDYQLIQPNLAKIKSLGANLICLEKIRPHVPLERAIMAIRFSPEIFGTQFHPEADAMGMFHYFSSEEKKELIEKNHGVQKYSEMLKSLHDPDKIMLTESVILPTFLNNSLESIKLSRASQPYD